MRGVGAASREEAEDRARCLSSQEGAFWGPGGRGSPEVLDLGGANVGLSWVRGPWPTPIPRRWGRQRTLEGNRGHPFFKLIYSLLKDNCFTEFLSFLSNLNLTQT